MMPARTRPPAAWMTDPAAARVLAALTRDGTPARFVGGAVRDWLVGRAATDIDIATPLPPDQVMHRLGEAGIKAIGTGIEHGTVTAITDGRGFEITTLRRDVETDGRHAVVAFTDDWAEDAKRRDFTMNALYADPDGTIYDPVDGLGDLDHGLVRFIGDAAERITEDHLRLLRFFRFLAHYGRAEPLDADLAACAKAAPKLATLSAERVWTELKKLLAAPDPSDVLERMEKLGVLKVALPERRHAVSVVRALVDAEFSATPPPPQPSPSVGGGRKDESGTEHPLPPRGGGLGWGGRFDPLRRLATLIDSTAIDPLADRLKLAHAERDALEATLDVAEHIDDALALPWPFLRKHGSAHVIDGALVAAAPSLIPIAEAWNDPPFPIGGTDLLALGLAPGPEIGRLLAAVERWWETGGCVAGRDACLARLKTLL